MLFYGLELLLNYRDIESKYWESHLSKEDSITDKSLEDLLATKVNTLTTILHDIEGEIKKRKQLLSELRYRLYAQYLYLRAKLFEMDQWAVGGNRAIESRRSGLEREINALKQEKRKMHGQAWKDIALLRKERRTWFKQYAEMKDKIELILGGKGERREGNGKGKI